jgi:pyruvate dehydrogenase E1 component alpha subunit
VTSLTERGPAYGIPALAVDATDVLAVRDAAQDCVERARRGDGPSLLELRTLRWRGHYEGDPQRYRDAAELARCAERDPIVHLAARLIAAGVPAEDLDLVIGRVDAELDAALDEARQAPLPSPDAALEDVYSCELRPALANA